MWKRVLAADSPNTLRFCYTSRHTDSVVRNIVEAELLPESVVMNTDADIMQTYEPIKAHETAN